MGLLRRRSGAVRSIPWMRRLRRPRTAGDAVRRVAVWVMVTGALAFVVIAALRVPWDPIPGGTLHPPSATSVFTRAEIQRAEDFAGLQRILSWTSLAVSLVLA